MAVFDVNGFADRIKEFDLSMPVQGDPDWLPWCRKIEDGGAEEYQIADHNYRTWKPGGTRSSDGTFELVLQIDHIVGVGRDDHAYVHMIFNPDGVLTESSVEIKIADRHVNTDVFKTAAAVFAEPFPAVAAVAAAIAALLPPLNAQIQEWREEGGQKFLPHIVSLNMRGVCSSVKPG